jgi:uncharacterized membrane protein YphA (DoxX/SURF4 family)
MPTEFFTSEAVAVFVARVFLGMLFFFQGMDAVFGVRLKGVIETVELPLRNKGVPHFLIVTGSYFTSYVQLVAGLLLIIGLFKYYALYLLGLDLIVASVMFGIVKPMWDMRYVFPRLILLLFLFLVPAEWDVLSLDYFWAPLKYVNLFSN